MDGAILTIAANEKCPQPQTREHLMVLDIIGLKNIVIVQNKIDLVTEEQARKNYQEIKAFIKGTIAENVPIIPVSSQAKVNLDALLLAMEERIPTPKRDASKPALMLVVRSFDVNKPGTPIENLRGGVLGGSLMQGQLKVGDVLEIRPGTVAKGKWITLKTKVTGLQKAGKDLEQAGAGGLLGVMTDLDPALAKADSLTGSIAGPTEVLPQVLNKLSVEVHLFKDMDGEKIEQIRAGEPLLVNIGTARTMGTVTNMKKGMADMDLRLPVAAEKGERTALSRRVGDRWRLIGWGLLK